MSPYYFTLFDETCFSANPFFVLVYAVDKHYDNIDLYSYDCSQYSHYLYQQHCYLLFIKAIVQHIVCFGYMSVNSCGRKKVCHLITLPILVKFILSKSVYIMV